jgi:hypothetical protein
VGVKKTAEHLTTATDASNFVGNGWFIEIGNNFQAGQKGPDARPPKP